MAARPLRPRAVTLAETLVAVFLLVAGIMVVVNLLHAALRYQTRSEQRALAALLARRTLNQVRAWAWSRPGSSFNFHGNWAAYNGVTLTDPNFPGLTVRVDANPAGRTLFSPATPLEQTYASLPRQLDRAVVPVRVRVDAPGMTPLILVSYVGEPPLTIGTLTINRVAGASGTLAQDDTVTLEAQALDPGGAPIPGLVYFWSVEPCGTNPSLGTLLTDTDYDGLPDLPRDGTRIVFTHRYHMADGILWLHKAGQCRVYAITLHQGREYRAETVLDLAPGPLP